jgi:3-hydroxyacyl-[acyl-carrier-protein] dehydratase
MPTEPLIDFDAIDLSTVVMPIEAIREICKQRGQFEMLDGILHVDPATDLVVGFKEIRADDWWAPFHIPGRPVFPGALMIEAVAQLCTCHFLQRRPDLEGSFVGFGGLDKTRFRATVLPDCRLLLVGRCIRLRSRMFTYAAQAFVERQLVFETEVMGVVV